MRCTEPLISLEKEMAPHSRNRALVSPRDRGACWAAIYGVAQSWTRLTRLSSSSSRRQLNQAAGRHGGRTFTITLSQEPRAPIFQLSLDWEPQKPNIRKVNQETEKEWDDRKRRGRPFLTFLTCKKIMLSRFIKL